LIKGTTATGEVKWEFGISNSHLKDIKISMDIVFMHHKIDVQYNIAPMR
jgi:hypothetical protein